MIKKLQALRPRRRLTRDEALALAEIQAAHLRRHISADQAAVTNQQLRSVPEVRIETVPNLGVSGATRRIGDLWIILLNADEAAVRHRFTIAHEFKHILDDEATTHLHRLGRRDSQDWLTERMCDYFAACLLMPRLWVKRAWGGRHTGSSQAGTSVLSLDGRHANPIATTRLDGAPPTMRHPKARRHVPTDPGCCLTEVSL